MFSIPFISNCELAHVDRDLPFPQAGNPANAELLVGGHRPERVIPRKQKTRKNEPAAGLASHLKTRPADRCESDLASDKGRAVSP
jgi:hypothetical protein